MTAPFRLIRPSTLGDAIAALTDGGTPLAGGTDLIPQLADGLLHPAVLVDLGALPLGTIRVEPGAIVIGGAATLADIAADPHVQQECPGLVAAIRAAASTPIRHRGTIAGNLLQGTRCPYFRLPAAPGSPNGVSCHLRAPGSGCSVRRGDQRAAAVLATGPCLAVHPSDLGTALVHAGANLMVAGPAGTGTAERIISVEELYADGPTVRPLGRGELITAITIPRAATPRAARFGKVRDRASFDFALVNATVSTVDGDIVIVVGGLSWGPRRCRVAEARLSGQVLDGERVRAALGAEWEAGGARSAGEDWAGPRFKTELVARLIFDLLGVAAVEPTASPEANPPRAVTAPAPATPATEPIAPTPIPARLDAAGKVTGAARYLADLDPPEQAVEGVFVLSAVAAGQIQEVDKAKALRVPGVVAVFGPGDLPRIGPVGHWAAGQSRVPLMDHTVEHEGQPVALVIAANRRAALEAASLVEVRYTPARPTTDLDGEIENALEIDDWAPSNTRVGSLAGGLATAAKVIDAHYSTADRHHLALEPAGVVARWVGDQLLVTTCTQWVLGVRAALAAALAIPEQRIRVTSPLVGGGFGAKGSTWGHEILAAVVSRELGRPVRLTLPRSHGFTLHGHHPATRQRIVVGATADGILTGLRHESVSAAAMGEDYVEHGSLGSRSMYACPNLETQDRIVRLHRPQPTFLRAPHDGPGMVALEIAMDELATELALDPVELRLRNDATADPTTGRPFSSRRLADCFRIGADRFGWGRRSAAPRSMRDGPIQIGWGVAGGLMSTFRYGASARVTLRRDGGVVVESATHEIGTGAGTALAIVASEVLGVDLGRIETRLGDSDLPEAGGTFGSATTLSVGSAVQVAARRLRQKLEELAGEPGLAPTEYGEVLALRRLDSVSEIGQWTPEKAGAPAMNAYGAIFTEVRVDPARPVPRVSRCVGVYSVGRVVNPVGARSQIIGGIIWGIGQALLEDSRFDVATGRFLARGFASYHVPVNADVGAIETHFVEEFDGAASLLGSRGVGEIGAIGVAAAIANAVYHATGVRVRDLPIRVEALL